jgi:hypothetical protein
MNRETYKLLENALATLRKVQEKISDPDLSKEVEKMVVKIRSLIWDGYEEKEEG